MLHPSPSDDPEFYTSVTFKRTIAFVIDSVIIFVLSLLILPFTGFLALLIWVPFFAVIGFAYRSLTLAAGSATFGMRFLGIELRDREDQPLSLSLSILHTAGFYLSTLIFPLQLLSLATILCTAKGQSLSDMLLDTVMLNVRH